MTRLEYVRSLSDEEFKEWIALVVSKISLYSVTERKYTYAFILKRWLDKYLSEEVNKIGQT